MILFSPLPSMLISTVAVPGRKCSLSLTSSPTSVDIYFLGDGHSDQG